MEDERRRSRRLQPLTGRDNALLKHGKLQDIALVENISAEGFRVCMHPGFEIKVWDTALLETIDGEHRVRVANIEEHDGWLHIVLEQTLDLILPQSPGTGASVRRGYPGRSRRDWRELVVFVDWVVGAIVVGFGLLSAIVGWRGRSSIVRTLRQHVWR